ncbi:unnamed protein product [Prunus armeniaca]|uniref:Uncharacterized protein n=1 Tax=Prunus armeniaca TaxID=36596 RepID=A0A6J5WYM5_PRUAR|nr:unnamed protein product [Prunus armeniaca]
MWLTIDMGMGNGGDYAEDMLDGLDAMCRHAVDRSCGRLVDINIEQFGTDDLLKYITDSCGGIKRLRLVSCDLIFDKGLSEVASKLTLLEELEISLCHLSDTYIKVVGRSCPLLKSFKLNGRWSKYKGVDCLPYEHDEEALAIAGTMRGLHHLQLFGNRLTNYGLRKILTSCPHLESLDLCQCFNLHLTRTLGEKCAQRIKQLRLPEDSINGYKFLDAVANDYEFPYAGRDYKDCDCSACSGEFNYDSNGNYSDDRDFCEIGFSLTTFKTDSRDQN